MEPITFDQAFEFLQNHVPDGQIIPALGWRAEHPVNIGNDGQQNLILITVHNYQITEEHWNLVMQRVAELPENEREMSNRYQYPGGNNEGWDAYHNIGRGILNPISTPYVPAVLRFVINHEDYENA
jgi:hypothetical protein